MATEPERRLADFWAKLALDGRGQVARDSEGRPAHWLPLIDHSADVAACFAVLVEQETIRRRFAAIARLAELFETQVARLSVLAALHDVGKVNIGFQNKALVHPPFTAGHVGPVLGLFGQPGREALQFAEAIGVETMRSWAEGDMGIEQFLIAALAHHGRPLEVGVGHDPVLWRATDALDPLEGVRELLACTRRWFPAAFGSDGEPLPSEPRLQHAFNGLLTLADWLGSHEGFFPFNGHGEEDRFRWSRGRAAHALQSIGLSVAQARASVGPDRRTFAAVSGHPPRPLQATTLEAPVDPDGSVLVLEAETGSGKTEAALARFLVLFQAGLVDGLYFALPTRTAATQVHGRVAEATARAFSDPASRPAVILAVPGYLAVDDREGQRLPGFGVLWNDDDRERWRFRGWAAERPKRYMAGAVIVGTIDQVLLSSLAVSHSHMRASALLRHLLVVDEVHASDAYMTRILEEVLSRHLGAGGHAILMSATLGASARDRLTRQAVTSLDDARRVPYPVLTRLDASREGSVKHPIRPAFRRTVKVDLAGWASEPDSVARRVLSAAEAGARVLVIRNTVRECLITQEALEREAAATASERRLFRCARMPAPHHSRFAREDRLALDRALESRFGKTSKPDGGVAIATQTVQQSLDLDADLLITDLCPIDVLLQRVGRLHRHTGRGRPPGFEKPRVVVLVPANRDLSRYIQKNGEARGPHGLGTVYEDLRILEATWRLIEQNTELVLPEMARRLVEGATHPEALENLVTGLGGPWIDHHHCVPGVELARKRLADLNLANWDAPFGDPDSLFPRGELTREIRTRLGEGDRLARLPEPVRSPFGQTVHELTIPAHLCSGAPADAQPVGLTIRDGCIQFTFGDRRLRYDRLGVRPERSDPQDKSGNDD